MRYWPGGCWAMTRQQSWRTLKSAIRDGATATDLSRATAYAAALRVASFGTSNEHSDWDTALHCFTYCNAAHQLLTRITAERSMELERPELLRGVFHGAMQVYLIRFLNVPPARLPGEGTISSTIYHAMTANCVMHFSQRSIAREPLRRRAASLPVISCSVTRWSR